MNNNFVASDDDLGGEGYLATVSDLVAGLVFVFILMLAVFAYQLADVTEDWRSADETRHRLLDDIAERLQQQGLRVEVLYEQGVLRLSENAVNFPFGGELPVPEHQVNVGHLARAVAEVVPCYVSFDAQPPGSSRQSPGYCAAKADPARYACDPERFPWLLETLLIEGHTDDAPVRPGRRFRDNLELSSMRAATVHRMITACEPGLDHLLNGQGYPFLSTSGYGAGRPIPDVSDRRENRRIDLRFLLEPPEEMLEQTAGPIGADVRGRMRTRR